MAEVPRILVVDDEEPIREVLDDVLHEWGYGVALAESGAEALALLQGRVFDVALLDIWMEGMTGVDLLREIKQRDPGVEVVMMTGAPTVESAVEALKLGAYDYLPKPLRLDELEHLLRRLLEHRYLRGEVRALRRRLAEDVEIRELIGGSPEMARVRELVAQAASADSPAVIEGETGTGKELIAASIHRLSARARAPFIPVNCGAIPANLLESEFFGHVRGAFTGAVSDAPGLFRSAQGGTLFLDEVTELPAALQTKLLRALQEREVRPVGSTKTYKVDVRVIAATNRSLDAAVQDGTLRPDLFYRLDVIRLVVPPLRERRGDIPILATHFIRLLNERLGRAVRGIRPEALAILTAHDFPGNVRELENVIERAFVLGARDEIGPADIRVLSGRRDSIAAPQRLPTLADAERELILRALDLHGQDRDQAARALGISPRTIYRRLKEYGLS